jgi:hypothetical protein
VTKTGVHTADLADFAGLQATLPGPPGHLRLLRVYADGSCQWRCPVCRAARSGYRGEGLNSA